MSITLDQNTSAQAAAKLTPKILPTPPTSINIHYFYEMSLRLRQKKVTKMIHKFSWSGDWSKDLINAAIFALITFLVTVVFLILKVQVC